MDVYTTDVLPNFVTIKQVTGMIEVTFPIKLSVETDENQHQKGILELQRYAKKLHPDANLIYGLRVATSVAKFLDGIILYVTYCGTVAIAEHSEIA